MRWCWWRGGGTAGGRPPAWWPQDEAWPPRGPASQSRRRRVTFMRRAWAAWWIFFVSLWLIAPALRGLGVLPGPPWRLFPLALFAALVFTGVAAVTMRRLASPIADLIGAADRVSNRDYTVRVAERGPDSVRSVARAFNDMASRLESQDRVRRQLMADIAHELRTPLTVIQGRLEGLLDGLYDRNDDQLEGILDDTRVLARLVEDLRTLAHAESGTLALHKEATQLDDLMHEVAESMRAEAERRGIAIDAPLLPEAPSVDADPVRIREVLANLVANAVKHTPRGGRISLNLAVEDARLVVRVTDTGQGIPAERLPRVFERFYKGEDSTGSGLGLAIARSLVEAHAGTITASSVAGSGTTITFTLPR